MNEIIFYILILCCVCFSLGFITNTAIQNIKADSLKEEYQGAYKSIQERRKRWENNIKQTQDLYTNSKSEAA